MNGFAHQREFMGLFQARIRRRLETRRIGSQFAIGCRASAGLVMNVAQACRQFALRHFPARGGGLDQHLTRGGSGHPHAVLTREAHRAAATGDLDVHDLGDFVDRAVQEARHTHAHGLRKALDQHAVGEQIGGGRLFHTHQVPVRIQFIGCHHRQRREHSLSHFGVWHQHGHCVVRVDAQPGGQEALAIRGERVIGNSMLAGASGGIADEQAAADHGCTKQKTTSIDFHVCSP